MQEDFFVKHGLAAALEGAAARLVRRLFVVRGSAGTGNRTPSPAFSAAMVRWCSVKIFRAMASPMPLPERSLAVSPR